MEILINFIDSNIFKTLVITIGIIIGFLNYKELLRKNNIDEDAYISFKQKDNETILIKNFGKTPILINKIESLVDNKSLINLSKAQLEFDNINDLMPNEEKEIKLYKLSNKKNKYYNVKIEYENHVGKKSKIIKIKPNIEGNINKYIGKQ